MAQTVASAATRATRAVVAVTFTWCLWRAAVFASYAAFSVFAAYDDEGYILVSVREFLAGRALYDEVFTQYGPAYYAYKHVLSLLHGLPTQDITRWTTHSVWISSATVLGAAAFWLTRSGVAAVAAFCLMTVALRALPAEAGHPQELLVALTSASVALAASPLRLHIRVIALVAVAAIAGMTKINVGAFIALAVAAAALPAGPGALRQAVAVALALLPMMLMSRHLTTWAWPYAMASGAAILTAVCMARDSGVRLSSPRRRAALAAAALAPAILLGSYVVARGTTVAALVDGLLVRPAALANLFSLPFALTPQVVAVSLAAAGFGLVVARPDSPLLARIHPLLPALKVGIGLYAIFWQAFNPAEIVGTSALVVFALLVGNQSANPHDSFGRGFLALSAALHTCTAYPVAGSQLQWSAFLIILSAVVCVSDGLDGVRAAIAESAAFNRIAGTVLACLALAVYYTTLTPVASSKAFYNAQAALPYQGSRSTRVSPAQAATYNWLVANLKGRCSKFVSLPGYNSLHLWSGIPPVNGYNATASMFLLNDEEQAAVVQGIRAASRPCAVYNETGVRAWNVTSPWERPLGAYIGSLTPVASRGGYELRVPIEQVQTPAFEYLLYGRRSFNGDDAHFGPADVVAPAEVSVRLWFRGRSGGTLLGLQSAPAPQTPTGWCPVLYVGQDGLLRAEFWTGTFKPILSARRVDDGRWHHVVLVKQTDRQRLYIDGEFVGQTVPPQPVRWATTLQLGTGFTGGWPDGNGAWFWFTGEMRDVVIAANGWDGTSVFTDYVRSADGEASR